VTFFLLPEVGIVPEIPPIPKGFKNIFLLNLPDVYRTRFEQKFSIKLVPLIENELWKQEA
jgi:hypothetical protein